MHASHLRTCNICEAMCGLVIEHDGSRVLSIRGDEDDVFSRGHICPKALALGDVHADPDRLRQPMRRVGDRWERCDWEEALDDIAERLVFIQQRHGKNAVALYLGNPTAHNLGALLFGIGLLKRLGTRSRFSATSVDQLPHMLAALEMFGHQLLMPVPDVDRSDFLVIMGANPLVSNGSLMSAPGIDKRLKALKRRGTLVVIDPRRTETAALADRHVFVRPGTDALLLAAVLHRLFADSAVDLGHLARDTLGIAELERAVAPFSPERVAPVCGVEAATIIELARDFGAAERAAWYGRVGVCTQRFGALNAWLINALNIVTGHLDRAGGMMFTRPAVDLVAVAGRLGESGHFDKGRTRVRGLPEFGGEYPAVALAEEIEAPGADQIKALLVQAGNPVLSVPNGRRLDRALASLELMVSVDLYKNETSRHAHYILPPCSQLEQSHYDLALHAFAVRNTAKFSPPLFQPPPEAKADWQILLELATRVDIARGGVGALAARAARSALLRLGPDRILDGLLRLGPYGSRNRGGLSLAALRAAPHGIDLGPLVPCLPDRLATPDRRVRLAPGRFVRDMKRLARELDRPCSGLLLIGRRQLRTNNSWLHNSLRMVKGRDRCTLLMHPDDARERGLAHGGRVRIRSRAGEIQAPLEVSDAMMPGVVSLPHGFGHDRDGIQLGVAARHAGVSVNDITDELAIDELSGTAVLNGVPVEVDPVPIPAE